MEPKKFVQQEDQFENRAQLTVQYDNRDTIKILANTKDSELAPLVSTVADCGPALRDGLFKIHVRGHFPQCVCAREGEGGRVWGAGRL